MTFLILVLFLLYIGILGFWIMKKSDTFFASGNIHPAWDARDEKANRIKRKQCHVHCSPKQS